MPYWVKPTGISAAGGYVIEGSAYGDGSSGYQSVAGSGSPTDDQNVTIEFWVKRHKLGTAQTIFDAYLSSNNYVSVSFDANDKLDVHLYGGGSTLLRLVTTRVYRDVAAFVHIAVTLDLDNGTQADRCQVRTNGTRETAFDTSTLPANTTTVHYVGYSGATHYIGRNGGGSNYFHDSISRIIVQDGQTTPVGPTDNGDGTISVADPTATIVPGNDGFWFEGGDLADATATDRSSASNNFTKTGTITATNDSPTDDAANGYGNRATLNPLSQGGGSVCTGRVFSNGNREYQAPNTATEGDHTRATMTMPFPNDKLTYIEFRVGTNSTTQGAGVCSIDTDHNTTVGFGTNDIGAYDSSTQTRIYKDGVIVGSAFTPRIDTASTDLVCIAYNGSDGKVWIGTSDGTTRTWRDSSGTGRTSDEPGSGTNPTATLDTGIQWFAYAAAYDQGTMDALVDADDWVHTAPSGAVELSTENLPAPAITSWQDHYYAEAGISHTTSSTTAVSLPFDLSTTGGMVRIKRTDSAGDWYCVDTERGGTKYITRNSTPSTEGTFSDGGFGSSTFTLSSDLATGTYIIEAFVQGEWFQIKTYAGTGVNRTISYDATLSATPGYFEVKNLDTADDWFAFHVSIGATKYLKPNQSIAPTTSSIRWNDTAPTTTGFTLGTSADVNDSGGDSFISYHWANGGPYKFGAVQHNGSTDGSVVWLGGTPQAYTDKRSDATPSSWVHWIGAKEEGNPKGDDFSLESTVAPPANFLSIDMVSTGIKYRDNRGARPLVYSAYGIQPFDGDGVEQARAR